MRFKTEIIAFAEATALGASRAPLPLHPLTTDLLDDTSDDNTFANMSGMSEKERDTENKYAGVGRSPILAYQPSLLGLVKVGPGKQGSPFEYDAASNVMHDLSHLGMIHRRGIATNSLIRLPKSFVELYGLVNRVRGRDEPSNTDDGDEGSSSETAICLLTGAVMRSGTPRRAYARATRPAGACTVHAREKEKGVSNMFIDYVILIWWVRELAFSFWFKSVQFCSCTITSLRTRQVFMSINMAKRILVYVVVDRSF